MIESLVKLLDLIKYKVETSSIKSQANKAVTCLLQVRGFWEVKKLKKGQGKRDISSQEIFSIHLYMCVYFLFHKSSKLKFIKRCIYV